MGFPAETLIYEGFSARARLGILGLDVEGLAEVVRSGEVARAQATNFDPVTAAGFDAYRYRVRAMRELYCPLGWHSVRRNGLELLGAPGGNMFVMTRGGNQDVGLTHEAASPQPTSDLGGAAKKALGGTLWLFGPEWVGPQVTTEPDAWMLLVHSSSAAIRAELSLGFEDAGGRVAHWLERIILPELDPDDLTPKRHRPSHDEVIEIDVPVIRKQK